MGFKTKVPKVARLMGKTGNFDVDEHKTWLRNPNDFKMKTHLMNLHFQKVKDAHAVLIVNYTKNGKEGYIGGNGLMEMTLAYLDKKPIFVLNKPEENLAVYEEVVGMNPIFLEGDITKLKDHLPKLKNRAKNAQ